MKVHHIKAEHLKTASWAGGTTTQLFIEPATATYTAFNFDFRVSFATVEVPESTFTFMPSVTRHLMILKGELAIDHLQRYSKVLRCFDTDTFNGEWPTKAKGQVMDFNLMTRGGTEGKLDKVSVGKNERRRFTGLGNWDSRQLKKQYLGFFVFEGWVHLEIAQQVLKADTGDFILFENISMDAEIGVIGGDVSNTLIKVGLGR